MISRVAKGGVTLAVIAAICTALVAATYRLTTDRIAANERAWLEQSLAPALGGLKGLVVEFVGGRFWFRRGFGCRR